MLISLIGRCHFLISPGFYLACYSRITQSGILYGVEQIAPVQGLVRSTLMSGVIPIPFMMLMIVMRVMAQRPDGMGQLLITTKLNIPG